MTYTIQLDLWIDEDSVYNEEDIQELMKDELEATAMSVDNIRLIDVND